MATQLCPYQICVVVRSAPQNIRQLLLSPVARLQIPADAVPDQEVDQRLAFLAHLAQHVQGVVVDLRRSSCISQV